MSRLFWRGSLNYVIHVSWFSFSLNVMDPEPRGWGQPFFTQSAFIWTSPKCLSAFENHIDKPGFVTRSIFPYHKLYYDEMKWVNRKSNQMRRDDEMRYWRELLECYSGNGRIRALALRLLNDIKSTLQCHVYLLRDILQIKEVFRFYIAYIWWTLISQDGVIV